MYIQADIYIIHILILNIVSSCDVRRPCYRKRSLSKAVNSSCVPSCSVTVFWQQGLKLDSDQATQFSDDSDVCLLSLEALTIVTQRYQAQAKLLLGILMLLVCGLQSYRKLAKEYHPDKNPDAGDKVWVTKTQL